LAPDRVSDGDSVQEEEKTRRGDTTMAEKRKGNGSECLRNDRTDR